jgi:hypothetical protein
MVPAPPWITMPNPAPAGAGVAAEGGAEEHDNVIAAAHRPMTGTEWQRLMSPPGANLVIAGG